MFCKRHSIMTQFNLLLLIVTKRGFNLTLSYNIAL